MAIGSKRPASATAALALCLTLGVTVSSPAADVGFRNVAVRNLQGSTTSLDAPKGGLLVLLFYSSECPISNAYSPTLIRLAKSWEGKPVKVVGLSLNDDLSDSEIVEHAKEFGLPFPLAIDRQGRIARKLGAKVTPEVFVLDDQGKTRYHGRIDDQFAGRGKRNLQNKTSELSDAVAALLSGKEPAKPYVEAVGCPLPQPVNGVAKPTYTRDVAPILQKNCVECHRKGQVGPFPLETFAQAQKRAGDLATVVGERRMPPWKPDPKFGVAFKHSRALSDDDIATINNWADQGAPEGNPADLPASPVASNDGWALGTPDLIVQPAKDFEIPATGEDIYRCFVLPTDLPKDVYISAIEYRPGNRRVVHHVLSYVDISGEGRKKDAKDPGEGYACFAGPGVEVHGDLGGWAPGNEPSFLPEGIGRSLPKGADVVMQVHYHPSGKPETDRTQMGLYFSKKPVKQTLHWTWAAQFDMQLPPGKDAIKIDVEREIPADVTALAATPHMHLLGKQMSMSVTFPDGKVQDLVRIGDWDFNWQNTYYFEKPINIPRGSKLRVVGTYDNSSKNPRNPNNPPKLVTWGEATTDEMCIGFLAIVKQGQDLTVPGAKDDLIDILNEQERQEREAYEKARREAEAKEKAKAGK